MLKTVLASAKKEIEGMLKASKNYGCNTEIVLNIGGTFDGKVCEKTKEYSDMTRELITKYYD